MPNEMMNDHDPPKRATRSATFSPNVSFLFDNFVRIACGAASHQLLRGVHLTAKNGKHVDPRMRLLVQQG